MITMLRLYVILEVLTRGLDGLFAITEIDANGERKKQRLSLAALPEEAHRDYNQLLSAIRTISIGISISPIDNIKFHIEQTGYSVVEVTGRGTELQFQKHGSMAAMVKNRKKKNVSDAFRKFNNHQVDVLLINQNGNTGARRFVSRFPVAVANVKKFSLATG